MKGAILEDNARATSCGQPTTQGETRNRLHTHTSAHVERKDSTAPQNYQTTEQNDQSANPSATKPTPPQLQAAAERIACAVATTLQARHSGQRRGSKEGEVRSMPRHQAGIVLRDATSGQLVRGGGRAQAYTCTDEPGERN